MGKQSKNFLTKLIDFPKQLLYNMSGIKNEKL